MQGNRKSFEIILVFILLFISTSHSAAYAPGEVPTDASFSADHKILSWSPVPGATSYNVYKGSHPDQYDHACRIYRTGSTSAVIDEMPSVPGELTYFLISAVNADGEGSLGTASSGSVRPNLFPCVDADADLIADNFDNCPSAPNQSQADQDMNGTGDACDSNTYDFESDPIGSRPVGMVQLGGADSTFTVKDFGGDQGVSYNESLSGVHDRFERLLAGMQFQNTTVYLDYDMAPETCSIELWSDGAYRWNAGSGAILQIGGSGGMTFYDRYGQNVPSIPGPAAPASGRLRIRLVKGEGNTSAMHVDAWDGAAFVDDHAIFPIADDHRYRGLGTVLANYLGGRRGVKRVTIIHEPPEGSLVLRKDPSWSSDWKIFQRDAQDTATIPLRFYYSLDSPGHLQARVIHSRSGSILSGHDWTDHQIFLGPTNGASGSLDIAGVQAGGNYDVEARLVRDSDQGVIAEGELVEIAVGDVFLSAGQSNMSGYSGNMVGAEEPIDEVHLFHNDYVWKRASEPMDDGADQVDKVSAESPLHSLMLRFGKEIYQATGIPVGIIPGPLGGTNLYSQWQRDESDHDNRGTLYGSMLHRSLIQNFQTPPRGFLWYQGESDAGRGTELYKADLQRLIEQYHEDLNNVELFIGIVQLATYSTANMTDWMAIQEAQRQVVMEDPLAVLSAAVDLPRSDGIHLNVDGYKRIGARLAAEFREHHYGEPIDASAKLLQARSADSGGSVELVYDAEVQGGASFLYQVQDSSGMRTVQSISLSGNIVTLNIQGRLRPDAFVTYGLSRDPNASWLKDLKGTAVPCFLMVPILQ